MLRGTSSLELSSGRSTELRRWNVEVAYLSTALARLWESRIDAAEFRAKEQSPRSPTLKGTHMRNTWKGLVIGGLTGAFVGMTLDLLVSTIEEVRRGAEHARERVPEATEWLQGATKRANEWVHENDVPVRVKEVGQRALDSDFANSANAAARKVIDMTKNKARSTLRHTA